MMYAGDRGSGQLGRIPPVELLCHDELNFRAVTYNDKDRNLSGCRL